MKLYLIRHGQSEANGQGYFQGQLNTKLTDLGKSQTKFLGERFKEIEDFEIIYTSDLKRAKNTAEEIHKFHKSKKLIEDKRIREISFGDFHGIKHSENPWKNIEDKNMLTRKAPNGENYFDMKKRVEEFLEEIILKNQNAILVCHGGVIRILLELILMKPIKTYWQNKEYNIENTSIFKLKINNTQRKIIFENCFKHLN